MYDFIIIGAGSAGCALANRLSEDPGNRVLLIEAGPRDWHPFIHMPAGLAKLVGKKGVNWNYSTEPEPELGGRRLWWPRGRVLGGSSSINAMCYVRGHRADYDQWSREGATGWDYASALPYFLRAENNSRGPSEYHGADGPLAVSDLLHRNALSDVFIEATATTGVPRIDDFNGPQQAGVGYYQVTQKNGARCSAARAYLVPARERSNLEVRTGVQVRRIVIEGGRAVGVETGRGNARQILRCSREVLLCSGAINSPQLLMLSGVGGADDLRRHGIEVQLDLPGVGANLQDHLDICTLTRSTQRVTYDRLSDLKVAFDYYLFRRGPGTSNIAESGGFLRSPLAEDARPDIQLHFVPAQLDDHGRQRLPGDGYTLHACFLRPKSRGRIELASADPAAAPRIFANYLSDAGGFDLKMMLQCARVSREILAQPAFAPFRGDELLPGRNVRSDTEFTAFIRRKAETIYHPVGTCRMGSDCDAVVDPELRVHGVDGLRVVDASVMPSLIGGNTNGPTIMIAERAADMILQTDRKPQSTRAEAAERAA